MAALRIRAPRFGRLCAATAAAAAFAGFGAAPAFAGLSDLSDTLPAATSPVEQAVTETVEDVTSSAATATEEATSSLAAQPAPLDNLETTIEQTAAPLLATVEETVSRTTATVDEVLAPTLESAGETLRRTTPVRARQLPNVTQAESISSPAVESVAAPIAATAIDSGAHHPGLAAPTRETGETRVVRPVGDAPRGRRGGGGHAHGSWSVSTAAAADFAMPVNPRGASARPDAGHSPLTPASPFESSMSTAPSGGGFFFPLVAVVAATLLLAAPGVGRRLRPVTAPLRLPILALSLERPG